MPRLELYPFKFRDRITGKWVRARHKLLYPELQRQYAEWEITGPPEIRHVTPGSAEPFSPFRGSASLMFVCFFGAVVANAATGDEQQFRAAFAQVKIGMTIDEVHRLGQAGNRCTDWPNQRPPVCGPLHYFSDKHTTETASGTTTVYSYGGEEIVYKNGVVVLIRR